MPDNPTTLPQSVLAATLEVVDTCVAIFTGDELRYAYVNAAYQALRPGVTMVGQRLRDVFPAAAAAGTEAALVHVLKSGAGRKLHRYHAPLDSNPGAIWEGEFFRTEGAEPGAPPSVVAFVRDVSESVAIERALEATDEALRKTNERLRNTIDSITDGLLVMDRDFRYTFVSARAAAIVGTEPEKLVGGIVWELFPGAVGTKFYDGYHEAFATGQPVHFEEYYPAPLEMWLECHCYPSADELTVYFRDVSVQRRADRALRDSTALLTAISDTSTDAIYAKDRSGKMRFANPATLALIGKSLEEALGKDDVELFGDVRASQEVMDNDRLVMDTRSPLEFEEPVQTVEGGEKIFLSRKIPYVDADGQVVGILGISRDITERKRTERALREESGRKDEFLAMLAHELRNPLAPIATGAQLLERFAGDEARVLNTARIIARQAGHMVALIDDLLEVSRVTRGLVDLKKEPLGAASVIARAVEQVQPMMDERGHSLTVAPIPADAWVNGDQTRLTQTIANILSNAAKFTPRQGRIDVAVSTERSWVNIVISDNGNGIEGALLPKVFDLFTQSDRAPDRAQGGLGLGLSLVQSIVTMHGGQVRAESEGFGKGSTFTVSLPRVAAGQEPGDSQNRSRAEPGAASAMVTPAALPSIMLVDDNADAGTALAELLGTAGYQVTFLMDGAAAIAAARKVCPDVFILDIGLPHMDGYELAARLKEQPAFAKATLIALTGYGQATDRARGSKAGFHHYFVKPVNLEMLTAVLGPAVR